MTTPAVSFTLFTHCSQLAESARTDRAGLLAGLGGGLELIALDVVPHIALSLEDGPFMFSG